MSKTARCWWAILALGTLVMGVMVVAGCGDKGTSPKITGSLPYSLDGVWYVIDRTTWGGSGTGDILAVYTDTICVAEPDFGIASADETWQMFLQYEGIIPGRWTDPVWDDWSVTLDDRVNAFFAGHASATLEECDFKIRIYIAFGFDPDNNEWSLKRTIERVEGRACGHHGNDTTLYTNQYRSAMERVGDAPNDCTSSDNVFGPPAQQPF